MTTKKTLLLCLICLQVGLPNVKAGDNEEQLVIVKKIPHNQEAELPTEQPKVKLAPTKILRKTFKKERSLHPKLRLSSSANTISIPGNGDFNIIIMEQPPKGADDANEDAEEGETIPSPAQELFINQEKSKPLGGENYLVKQISREDKQSNSQSNLRGRPGKSALLNQL